jgi:hypothetical protein
MWFSGSTIEIIWGAQRATAKPAVPRQVPPPVEAPKPPEHVIEGDAPKPPEPHVIEVIKGTERGDVILPKGPRG